MNYITPSKALNITVGSYTFPCPSEYKVAIEDVDSEDSKRYVTTGKMNRKRIRAEILKLTLTYKLSDLDNINDILDAIRPVTFTASVYAPEVGSRENREFYCNKKEFSYKRVKGGVVCESFTFDMTEV